VETKIIVIAAIIIAATVVLGLAPSLTSTALAVKTKQTTCTNGQSSHVCQGQSGTTPGATITTSCTAGNPPKPNHPNCSGA
jgi:hypothetical protein